MREFETGATRDSDEHKLDYEGFISPLVLKRYAQYMHKHRKQKDGKLRDSDNWQKGIPKLQYRKSLIRHLVDAWLILRQWQSVSDEGEDIEDLLCAIKFNTDGLLYEILTEQVFEKLQSEKVIDCIGDFKAGTAKEKVWCPDCEAKIAQAKNMDAVAICSKCAERNR